VECGLFFCSGSLAGMQFGARLPETTNTNHIQHSSKTSEKKQSAFHSPARIPGKHTIHIPHSSKTSRKKKKTQSTFHIPV